MYTDFNYLFLESFPVLYLLSSLLDVSDNSFSLLCIEYHDYSGRSKVFKMEEWPTATNI